MTDYNDLLFQYFNDFLKLSQDEIIKRWNDLLPGFQQKIINPRRVYPILASLIEYNAPVEQIKVLFEYNEEEHKKERDLLKWAAGYSHINVVRYIENKLNPISQEEKTSIVRAAIKNYRVNNVEYLMKNNYPVINLFNFFYVMSDSQYYFAENKLIDLFCRHLDRIENLDDPYLIPHIQKVAQQSTRSEFKTYILPIIDLISMTVRKTSLEKKLNQTPTYFSSKPKL